jgi:peptidyl-prolyl cis-trans isomerase B (cyclophilin B)
MPILLSLLITILLPFHAAEGEPPYIPPSKSEIARLKSADVFLARGTMRFELFPEDTPAHVVNFKYLADKGFYRGLTFHLIYPQVIIQGGAPNPNLPNSGPGYSLEPEFSQRQHVRGTLGMARLPNEANTERASHGSQFHILLAPNHRMDSQYTIFGQCIFNCELLDEIQKGEKILDIKVYVRN